TPRSGYAFVNWTEGATTASTLAAYSFTVSASRSLVANFIPVFTTTTETQTRSVQWQVGVGGTGNQGDYPYQIAQAADGGIVFAGNSYNAAYPTGGKTAPNYGGSDIWVVKVDGNGTKLWDKSFGGTSDENVGNGHALKPTSDGGFILVGNTKSGPDGNKTSQSFGGMDGWVVK